MPRNFNRLIKRQKIGRYPVTDSRNSDQKKNIILSVISIKKGKIELKGVI